MNLSALLARKTSSHRFSHAILLGLVGLLVGCPSSNQPGGSASSPSGNRDDGSSGARLRVVATVGMVGDLVRRVGEDRISVTQICGPGIDPHLHTPTRDDVKDMLSADAIFYSGLMLEGRMEDRLRQLSEEKIVFAITDSIPKNLLFSGESSLAESKTDDNAHPDPHAWMDPSIWKHCVSGIASKLTELDPEGATLFEQNASRLMNEMDRLHLSAKEVMATIPDDQRLLVTSHDAFNYFGRAFDLEVRGVQGISTQSEAGLNEINALVNAIVERKVKSVFIESSVSPRNIEALVEGAAAKGHNVAMGGELYSDAMGPEGTPEGTYLGMIEHNVRTVVQGLGGAWNGPLLEKDTSDASSKSSADPSSEATNGE